MNDLFQKRMKLLMPDENLGKGIINSSNIVENKNFAYSTSYRKGRIFDWNLQKIDDIDFHHIKNKTFTGEGYEVEYNIKFRPDINVEYLYKDRYYIDDGKARYGLYVDIQDPSTGIFDKWLIAGKDDKYAFDRYIVYKCNWCLEWVDSDKYYMSLGVFRDSISESSDTPDSITNIGGSIVTGDASFILPSSETVSNIKLGTRVMISDNTKSPTVYEVIAKKDSSPLGITKLYLRRTLFNKAKDFVGDVNKSNINFIFNTPIADLPENLGKNMHYICNAIKEATSNIETELTLVSSSEYLYIGSSVTIKINGYKEDLNLQWHIYVDNQEYTFDELKEYFTFNIMPNEMRIEAINKVMAKYNITIKLSLDDEIVDSVSMEVSL